MLDDTSTLASSDYPLVLWTDAELERLAQGAPPPEPPVDLDARNVWYRAQITMWAAANKQQRAALAASHQEIGVVEGFPRKKLIFNAVLDLVAVFYRQNPHADCAVGLIVVIGANSDNSSGACSLSVRRLADVLHREPDAIRAALEKLRTGGQIGRQTRAGHPTLYWLLASQWLAFAHHSWVVDAYSEPAAERGRRPGVKPLRNVPDSISPRLDQKPLGEVPEGITSQVYAKPIGDVPEGLPRNPSGTSTQTPQGRPRDDFTLEFTENKRGADSTSAEVVELAIDHYNDRAKRHGWTVCSVRTDPIRARVANRLDEIGGLANWDLALDQVPFDDWLSGRVQPKDHQSPFKLNINSLLRTDGRRGDQIANLINEAKSPVLNRAPGDSTGLPANWWRDNRAATGIGEQHWRTLIKAHSNRKWNTEMLGPAPGTAGCVVPMAIQHDLQQRQKFLDQLEAARSLDL